MALNPKYKSPVLWAIVGLLGGLFLAWLFFDDQPDAAETVVEDHAHEESTIYTCSMHPQVRQNEPGLCPLCGMELIPVGEGLEGEDEATITLSSTAATLAGVETITVGTFNRSDEGAARLQLSGQLAIAESNIYSQVAHIPGRIEQLFVNTTGESVRKGQAIASIYSPELLAAQQELLQAARLNETGSYTGLLDAAREKLRQYRISEAQIQRIEEEGRTFDRLTIVADVGGVVTELMVNQGAYVQIGQPLFRITRLDQLWVELEAYENQLPLIQLGDSLNITINATGNTYPAIVTFIDPVLDPNSRTVRVRAEVANPKGNLRPQMLVQATLEPQASPSVRLNETTGQALVLPRSAVLWTGERSVVYIKPDANQLGYQMREVMVQPAGENYLVTDGLSAGDEVVVNGAFVIDAAAQLRNKPSMMNRALQAQAGPAPAKPEEVPNFSTPPALEEDLSMLVITYLKLKDALVAARPEEAREAANSLQAAAENLDANELPTDAAAFLKKHQQHLNHALNNLLKEKNIDGLRRYFIGLSEAMLALAQAFPLEGQDLFMQFCPMANNDAGAYWLSAESEVLNPYYGDMMLSCGETIKEL